MKALLKNRYFLILLILGMIGIGAFVLFKLKKNKRPLSAPTVSNTFQKKNFDSKNVLFHILNDFETTTTRGISADKAVSGTKSLKFSMSNEFGPTIVKPFSELNNYKEIRQVKVELKSWAHGDLAQAFCILNIENKEGASVYKAEKTIVSGTTYEWNSQSFIFDIDEKFLGAENTVKLQLWNKSLREFYIDDLSLTFLGTPETNTFFHSNYLFDFEEQDSTFNSQSYLIKQTNAHSGKMCFDLSNAEEYGPIVTKQLGDVGAVPAKKVSMSIWVYPLTDKASIELAVSLFDKNDKGYFWIGKTIGDQLLPKEQWTKVNASIDLPAEGPVLNDVIQVLARNKGKTKLLFDDFEVVYDPLKQLQGTAPAIDPNLFYQKQFVGEKNKPPFPTFFLTKTELKNNTANSITSGAELTSNDLLLPGDFFPDKNGFDELLCIQNGQQQLYSYSPEENMFKIIWENNNSGDSIWNNSNEFYSGDFNQDKKFDVLIYNTKTKSWSLINFDGKIWKVMERGMNPPPGRIIKPESVINDVIAANDELHPWGIEPNGELLLKLNTTSRFDLKLIERKGTEFTILANIDFRGYPADQNPKYYETIKMVSGKFTNKFLYSVLVIACNCGDKNYKGKKCAQFENIQTLPNTVSLYQMQAQ